MNQKRAELREKRTRNTKTFENQDHSRTTEIYFSPVHYQEEDGSWKEMDDSLTDEDAAGDVTGTEAGNAKEPAEGNTAAGTGVPHRFSNRKGKWQVRFARRADEQALVTLTKDSHHISWGLEHASDAEAAADGANKILYPEVLPGVDAQYRTFGESVKENVILKNRDSVPEEISFLYRTGTLTAVQMDGRIVFQDETGKEVFCFSAPLMQDAKGARSDAMKVVLEEVLEEERETAAEAEAGVRTESENAETAAEAKAGETDAGTETGAEPKAGTGVYRITVIPDQTWLLAEDRQYPVVIDPVTTTSRSLSDIEDAHVDNLNFGTTYEEGIFLKTMGGDNIQRSFMKFTLPTLKTGDMIVNARLVLVSLAESGTERSVAVHKVLQDWFAATLTWNNRPTYDSTVEDIIKYTGDEQKYITLDITNLVKNWYINGGNYGLMIKDPHELSGYTEFLASDCHEGYEDMRPHIDITYMNYSGLEDYWTYHTQSAGRAGTVHVNDYNGNMILIHDTLTMGGSRMPVNLSHVYNTNDCQSDIGYGYGFRLNYHQTLVNKTIGGTEYYQHTDADGTQCYFYYDSEKEQWKDETGKDLTLTVNGTGAAEPFVIKDKEENSLIFDADGKLVKLKDRNGNALTITYTNERISKLTDGAGRVTTLTYDTDDSGNADHLLSVKSPSGQVKSFAYTDGKLTTITDVDGEEITYTYSSRKMITRATNIDGYEIRLAYGSQSPYRVKTIAEYGDGTAGQRLNITYGYNSTRYKDIKGRTEIFRFNNSGNLIHIHDGFGHAASGKYNRNGNHVNCLENETKLQSNVVQLLKDPVIQAAACGWKNNVSDADTVTCSINTDTSYVKLGTRSLCIRSTDETQNGYWYQEVKAKKGQTYTFSMYVRAALTSVGSGGYACIRLRGMDKDGNYVRINSQKLTQSTSGFVKLAVSYTVPEDAASDTLRAVIYFYKAVGSFYADMAQLGPGSTPGRCNLVDNGDFHLGTVSGFTGSGTTPEDMLVTSGGYVYRAVQCALAVTADTGSLYEKADTTSTKLASLSKGAHLSELNMFSDSSGTAWYRARTSGGLEGYIKLSEAAPYTSGGSGHKECIVAVSGAVLRSDYSDSASPVLYTLPRGTRIGVRTTVKYDADGKGWLLASVCYGDSTRYSGYIPEEHLMYMGRNHAYGTVTAAQALYLEPSADAGTSGSLAAGATAVLRGTVKKADGTAWYGVMSGTQMYYIPSAGLTVTTAPATSHLYRETAPETVGGLDEYVYKFQGDPEKDKKLTKTLALSGEAGDTYMVNAWGRGDALPETDNDTARRFGVEVVFVGSDGAEEVHYTNFSPDILDWQFLSDVYVAKAAYTSIKVSYTYCHNANLAYFAGLSLFREEYGQTYVYDEDNNVISVTDAQEQSRTFEYSSSQDLTGITDAKGNEFTYEYDSNHNVTKGTSAEDMVYKLSYDTNGNITKSGAVSKDDETAGTWMTRTFTSDGNHVASVTDARGCTVGYTWNTKKDLITKVTDANENAVSYTYDTKNRLTKVSQSVTSGSTAQTVSAAYGYTKDKLTSITHNGFQYGFAYDGYGRTKNVSVAGSALASYEYEEKNGNLTKLTYGNGDYIRYVYDDQDRLTEEYLCPTGTETERLLRSYVYDTEGNLYQVTDHSCGKTYTLSYDLLDRLVRVTDENGSDYQCFYDAENSLTQLRHAADGTYRNTKYTYDKDSRETKTTTGTVSRSTSYDAWGRVSGQVWDRNANDIYQMTYEYPDSGVNKIVLPSAVTRGTVRTEYVYDGNGNITSLTEGDKTTTYVYDELNRLIRENNAVLNKTITYSYDAGGNLVEEKEYAFTTGTLPASATKTTTGTYSSTWKDQLLGWNGTSMTYDGCGNMLTKGSTTYTWTQGRRLSGVESGKSIKYYYDHTGARVKKEVDGTVTEYRMAGRLIVSEKTGSSIQWYHYDSAGNPYAAGIGGIRYYFLRNLQGDVVGLIDGSGDVVVEYQYDSWGNTISITGSLADTVGQKNPFRYRGYYYDTETGLYYVGSRYYDAGVRRFISADDMEYLGADGSALSCNLYAYCMNNPVNRFDANGNWSLPNWAKVAIGAVATVAAVAVTVATGGAAAPVLIGVAASTLGGAAAGAISNRVTTGSWEGTGKAVLDGAANGIMTGGLGALGGSVIGGTVRTVKNAKFGITIGKMGTFEDVAKLANVRHYSGLREFKFVKKYFGEDVAVAVGWWQNKCVVKGVMALKGPIYNCGGALTGAYAKEVILTKGYPYLYHVWLM